MEKKPDYVSYDGVITTEKTYSGTWKYNVAAKKAALKFEFKMRDANEAFHPACRDKSMILDFNSSKSNVIERLRCFWDTPLRIVKQFREDYHRRRIV